MEWGRAKLMLMSWAFQSLLVCCLMLTSRWGLLWCHMRGKEIKWRLRGGRFARGNAEVMWSSWWEQICLRLTLQRLVQVGLCFKRDGLIRYLSLMRYFVVNFMIVWSQLSLFFRRNDDFGFPLLFPLISCDFHLISPARISSCWFLVVLLKVFWECSLFLIWTISCFITYDLDLWNGGLVYLFILPCDPFCSFDCLICKLICQLIVSSQNMFKSHNSWAF